jgi:hypothetical protein
MAKTRAPRKPRAPKAVAQPEITPQDITIELSEGSLEPIITQSGAMEIPHDDGSITVDFSPAILPGADIETARKKHDSNLAEVLDTRVLGNIADELLDGIAADDQSRQDWLGVRTRGLDMLAIKVEQPRSGAGASSAPLEGMSVYRDPTLSAALLRFQAEAQGELLPAAGPVKVVDYGTADSKSLMLSERLEKDLNFYLTNTASEYYPDSARMFWETGFSGLAFKKVYRDPLKRRPVSETVEPEHLIVSDAITDLKSAKRITHEIRMKPSVMKRMQIVGVYRDASLTEPSYDDNQYDEKVARIQGVDISRRPEDEDYQVYECYCELDIEGFEHKNKKGKATGLPLPYRVTIEKESREILEIRRNWREDDEDQQARIPFVAFPYATGPGFWGVGLLHLLGNPTMAITALTREAIDAGMFANFPGFLIAKQNTRQMTNEFRVAPGSGVPVDTGGASNIRDAIMPLPYKEAGPGHMQLISTLTERAERLGNTANMQVGEGKQNAPVGTTLALIEQATKVEGAVLKRMMAAQGEEFGLLLDLFRDDPEALWRGNRRPALGNAKSEAEKAARVELFKQALEDCEIVPKADPNVPSRLQRMQVVIALREMAKDRPEAYDLDAIDRRAMTVLGIENPEELFAKAPPQALGPDPIEVAKVQVEQEKVAVAKLKVVVDAENKAKDRESKQNIEVLKLANTLAVHPESNEIADEQIMQLAPLMSNIRGSMQNPMQAAGGAPPMPPRAVPVPGLGGIGRPPMQFSPKPMPRPMPNMNGMG